MISKPSTFSTDPGKIFDFSAKRPAEIFNEAILPRVNAFAEADEAGLDEARQRRQAQLSQDLQSEAFAKKQDDDFLAQLNQPAPPPVDLGEYAVGGVAEYDSPVSQRTPAPVAQNLTDFVKHFEGYSPKAFGDYKQTSIGYGTRAQKGETTITKEEAERRLAAELSASRREVESVSKKHGYDFAPNQMDALTSFAYNVGSLNQLTNNGKRSSEEIAQKMLEYNKAGGKVLPGLVNRRKAEYNLFTKGY